MFSVNEPSNPLNLLVNFSLKIFKAEVEGIAVFLGKFFKTLLINSLQRQ